MKTKRRKIIIEVLKFIVAGSLLGWVLSQASWHDYVTIAQGPYKGDHAFVGVQPDAANPRTIVIDTGMFWWKKQISLPFAESEPIRNTQGQPNRDAAGNIEFVRKGFISSLKDVNVTLLAIALLGFLLSVFVVAIRWWFLLRLQDIRIRAWEAIRLTFLGNFFNLFMPSTVGGDLAKAYYVSKYTPRKAAVLVSIFVDRVLGLTELALLASVMLVMVLSLGLETFERLHDAAVTVAVVMVIVVCALTFLLSARVRQMLHLQKLYSKMSFAHHIAAAGDAAKLYRRRLPGLAKAIAITFGAHILWVGSVALIGMSLPEMRSATSWYSYFVYIPLIYIIGSLPITIGGVGLIEKLYIVGFATVSPSIVLVLALLARFLPILCWGVPGFIVYMNGPRIPKAEQMEAELEAGGTPQRH